MFHRFLQQPKPVLFAAFSSLIVLISIADVKTGYEVSLGIFYTLPVILTLWYCGKWPGLGIAIMSIAIRHVVDILSKRPFSHEWIRMWTDGIRFVNISLILYLASHAKAQIEEGHTQIKSLLGILPICTTCKRIRGKDGYWTEVDSYLRTNSLAEPSAKLCPECSMRHFAKT